MHDCRHDDSDLDNEPEGGFVMQWEKQFLRALKKKRTVSQQFDDQLKQFLSSLFF